MKPPRGFSLMELVVTIVIVAIISAVAIPLFNDAQIKESWYREEVKAAVRYAQRQAVAQRRNVHVIVQPTQIELCYTSGPCGAPLTRLTNGQAYTLIAPSGTSLSPAPQSFWFNGLGQPNGAISFSVGAAPITVTAETGYVQ